MGVCGLAQAAGAHMLLKNSNLKRLKKRMRPLIRGASKEAPRQRPLIAAPADLESVCFGFFLVRLFFACLFVCLFLVHL